MFRTTKVQKSALHWLRKLKKTAQRVVPVAVVAVLPVSAREHCSRVPTMNRFRTSR